MNPLEVLLVALAGIGAGAINAVVGSGTVLTFSTLLTLGYSPIVANVSSNIGVLPGSFAGAFAYRRTFQGKYRHVLTVAVFSAIGGALGATLLLVLPAVWFDAIVPILIAFAVVLVIAGPRIKKAVLLRGHDPDRPDSRAPLFFAAGATGVYGGYFGAAQGVLLLSFLTLMVRGGLQRANAYKNVLASTSNIAAAFVFIAFANVDWLVVLILAVSSPVGGYLGGRYGQRIPEAFFRWLIVVIGIAAIVYFYMT